MSRLASTNHPVIHPTAAVLHGFAEGPLISRHFRRLLEQRGFRVIKDAGQADIIVAHSAGAWFIPAERKAKTILIIGPSTGYEGGEFRLGMHKFRQDYQGALAKRVLTAWLTKSFCNAGYLCLRPRLLARTYRAARQQRHALPVLQDAKVAVITFRDDQWSNPVGKKGLYADLPYTFINFGHLHDDLWIQPEEYVPVLQYLHAT